MNKNMSQQTNQIYGLGNVPLFEAIYGENLISLGGLDAIDNMFSDVDLRKLKALDVGFGLGGVAFYLAKKYPVIRCSQPSAYSAPHDPKSILVTNFRCSY